MPHRPTPRVSRFEDGRAARHAEGGRRGGDAYATLKELAAHYRFTPGEHLHTSELAKRLDVSVTPVREALIRLTAEGLIAAVQGRGFFAKVLSAGEMLALHELALLILRQSLEQALTPTAESGCGVSVPGSELAESAQEDGPWTPLRVELAYERIALLSRNPVMLDAISNFNDRTRFVRGLVLARGEVLQAAGAVMNDALDAIAQGQGSMAVALLREHFHLVTSRVPRAILGAFASRRAADAQARSAGRHPMLAGRQGALRRPNPAARSLPPGPIRADRKAV